MRITLAHQTDGVKILLRKVERVPLRLKQWLRDQVANFHAENKYRRLNSLPKNKFPTMKWKRVILAEEISVEAYVQYFPGNVQVKLDAANDICAHVFDLLGSGPTQIGRQSDGYNQIPWHEDFITGYKWSPLKYSKRLKFGKETEADVKVPWELSRCQHLVTLGQAYFLSQNLKYYLEYKNQIKDWIQHNPIGFGINWACTMDVAIRVGNWLTAMEFFIKNIETDETFSAELENAVLSHGRYILENLENKTRVPNNHYVANLVGLFAVSVYLPCNQTRNWQNFGFSELSKEMQRQVYDDGCNFEASTCYHRLATELFFYAALLAERANLKFPTEYNTRLLKMFTFVAEAVKPNGLMPQIGDNDNGQWLKWQERKSLDQKYLLSLAGIYFKIPDFRKFKYIDEDIFWIFGKAELIHFKNHPISRFSRKSVSYNDTGWYILRDDIFYCFISCGKNGLDGIGGHAHSDKLAVEVNIAGDDIFIDAGSYTYRADLPHRRRFQGVNQHNTIQIGDREQNLFNDKNQFDARLQLQISLAETSSTQRLLTFEGRIIDCHGDHIHRKITIDSWLNKIIIEDSIYFNCGKRPVAVTRFLIPGRSTVDQTAIISNGKRVSFKLEGFSEQSLSSALTSPSYGLVEPAHQLTLGWRELNTRVTLQAANEA